MALTTKPGPKVSTMPRGVNWRSVGLWFGLLAGPLCALADVAVSEAYVEHAESGAARTWLVLVGALSALVTIAAGVTAWRLRGGAADEDELTRVRVAFMGVGGTVISIFTLLVLVAILLPKLLLAPGDIT
jgi:hypothetical protein